MTDQKASADQPVRPENECPQCGEHFITHDGDGACIAQREMLERVDEAFKHAHSAYYQFQEGAINIAELAARFALSTAVLTNESVIAFNQVAYVRDQLGHSSIQVTVDLYGHLVPGGNRAAMDRLDTTTRRNPDATEPADSEAAASPEVVDSEVVSREGIEPSTRRLRVCCSAN